jgi:hypothetical protein
MQPPPMPQAVQYPQSAPPPPPYQQPPTYAPPPQYAYPPPVEKGFVADVYSKAFGFLFKKPMLLWGLSLLCSLLTLLAIIFGVFPIVWLPIVLVLELGMANIFLSGYRGNTISAALLFEGFRNKFFRNFGGMGWRSLWLLIWVLIPLAGIVIAIIKFYSYRFVPYIMLADPNILATDALKKSISQTQGYKGKMFLTDIIVIGSVILINILFVFILRIPFLGPVLYTVYTILLVVLLPLLIGTIEAIFYDKITGENPTN